MIRRAHIKITICIKKNKYLFTKKIKKEKKQNTYRQRNFI